MWRMSLSDLTESLQRLNLDSEYALRTWKTLRLPWVVPVSTGNVSAPIRTSEMACRIALVNLARVELTSGNLHPTR